MSAIVPKTEPFNSVLGILPPLKFTKGRVVYELSPWRSEGPDEAIKISLWVPQELNYRP